MKIWVSYEKLRNITEKSNGIPTPAMIVVGEVVKLREDLKWFEEV